MYIIGKIVITTVIPDQLLKLKEIAYNLWWSWNPDAIDLFRDIDLPLWEKLKKNPVRFLQEVSRQKLLDKVEDTEFMKMYWKVCHEFDSYMSCNDTWFSRSFSDKKDHHIAYFSAEYGLNEVLPIYSGGLGVLSGDHCKSASDLGLPFTAVGLFYKQGYFNQSINQEGWQLTEYNDLITSHLPIVPVNDAEGRPILINVDFPGRVVYAKVWQVKIGRVSLYLMDTDIEQNSIQDRMITTRLYGGDQETRIQQEILLGLGGYRVLDALGISPTVYHMNEGHSAFLGLEIIRKLVQENNLTFRVAKEVVSSLVSFTTHTSVPAGNDVFPLHMIDKYFSSFWAMLGISRHEFLDLGLKVNDSHNFNMTVLALTLAGKRNGVSKLHGAVTRNIFNNLWPGVPEEEVPVEHVTNGIHTLTWLSPKFKNLYDQYLVQGWEEKLYEKKLWKDIDNIPDTELWETHYSLKIKMIDFIRNRVREQRIANGESIENIKEAGTLLDADALTIGFARRFATYKRANLIFRDLEKARSLFSNPVRPIQIIFAGKAHPADKPAQEVIKNIQDITKQEGFRGRVVLIENYNMTVARNLVQGVDLWMNNPRRPLEASGTSGQKVYANGVVNFSVLDGWWCEGYNGKNGFTIGNEVCYENEWHQDNSDSLSIYDMLENKILPLFYKRNQKGVPLKWVALMKESIKSLAYQYNTHRMVQDYTTKMYVPSMDRVASIKSSNYQFAKDLSEWKLQIEKNWPQIKITADKTMNLLREHKSFSGEETNISVLVDLGSIHPSHVKVEVYYGYIGKDNVIEHPKIVEMSLEENVGSNTYRYGSRIKFLEGGEYGYTIRVVPNNPHLINRFEQGLVKWVVQ